MRRPLVVEFTKMSGAGNDFVVLDNRFYAFSEADLATLARALCHRTEGVGADGLMALGPGEDGADFRMHYHNADGSRASMCGNGARCLARFARLAGLGAEPLTFDTDAGRYVANVPGNASEPVRLHVPPPRSLAAQTVAGCDLFTVWTGTDHAVVFVADAAGHPLAATGPAVRHAPELAPRGTNVNVVEVLAPDRLRVRTWERGVEGETQACGTGALASAVAARLTGRVGPGAVAVEMPGGTLGVAFEGGEDGRAESVRGLVLDGPARVTFRGTVEVDPATLA